MSFYCDNGVENLSPTEVYFHGTALLADQDIDSQYHN